MRHYKEEMEYHIKQCDRVIQGTEQELGPLIEVGVQFTNKPSAQIADKKKRRNSKIKSDKPDNQVLLPFAPAPRRAEQSVEKACKKSLHLNIASEEAKVEEKLLSQSNVRAVSDESMDELDRHDADGNSSHTPTSILEIGRCEKKRNRKAKDKAILAMGESTNLQV